MLSSYFAVNSNKVKALNGSVFKFDSIDQIATNDASFMVYNNSSIYIGDKLKVGKTGAMVDLKPIEGASLDKPLAAYEVNGDGTVGLIVLGDATINNGLDCMVGGWQDSIIRFKSTIKMVDYNLKNSGMIDSNYEGMLFIDNTYMVGGVAFNGQLPVFSGRDIDRASITFSTLNDKLITGVLGNATINQAVPNYMSLYPRTNIISRNSVVSNKSNSTVNLYTIERNGNKYALSSNTTNLNTDATLFWSDENNDSGWQNAIMEITAAKMDVEPTVGQVVFAFTTPEYADYDVKWTVDGQVVSNTGYAYRVKEGDTTISATILPKGGFKISDDVQSIQATVTNTGVTTTESLYYKFLGEASTIRINDKEIIYTDSKNSLRLRIVSQLNVENRGKLILGGNTENTTLNVMGTLNLEDNKSISLINGNVELKSTAKVNVKGKESIGKNGNDIKFLNLKAPEDKLTIEFTKAPGNEKGTIFIYDAVDMTQPTYDELIKNYGFLVESGGKLTVDDEVPETPAIPENPDQPEVVKVSSLEALKSELTNTESEKTIVIEFADGTTITENIKITNRNVKIDGNLVFEGTGNITLAGNTKITLNTGANVVMPNFFDLKEDNTNSISSMYGSMLIVGSENILGGVDAQLDIYESSEAKSVEFKLNGDLEMLTIVFGNVKAKDYTLASILVAKGGVLDLSVTELSANGIVTSAGGSILINSIPLLANGGPIEPAAGFESTGDIIQLRDKVITLCSNITLNAALSGGFVISTNAFKTDTYSVLVKADGISASTLGLGEGALSKGTYTVVNGVWTPNNLKVEDSNQAVDIVAE